MSAERILRSVAPTLSATTSQGPSAVNVKMDISSEVTGRPALVSGTKLTGSSDVQTKTVKNNNMHKDLK